MIFDQLVQAFSVKARHVAHDIDAAMTFEIATLMVEALVQLSRPEHIDYLNGLFALGMSDQASTWHLDSDGTWQRHHRDDQGNELINVHDAVMDGIQHRRKGSSS
jgi:polyphosphate kinase